MFDSFLSFSEGECASCSAVGPHGLGILPGSSVHGILQARIWNGLPFPSPADLPDSGIKPGSPISQADSLLSEPPGRVYNPISQQNSLSISSNHIWLVLMMISPRLLQNLLNWSSNFHSYCLYTLFQHDSQSDPLKCTSLWPSSAQSIVSHFI